MVRSRSLKMLKLLVGPSLPKAGPTLEMQLMVVENVLSKLRSCVLKNSVPRAILKI